MSQNDDPRDDLPAPAEEFVHDSSDAPADPARRRLLAAGVGLAGLTLGGCNLFESKPTTPKTTADLALDRTLQAKVRHIVVIYAENRSFSNLYGNFPGVQYPLESVPASRYVQFDRDGRTPLATLPAIWGGLVPEAQEVNGKRYAISEKQMTGLRNAPFHLVDAQGQPLPNGVITRDLVHRFYQNQMQINAGRNNQFAAWGDSGGLVMGHYRNSADTLRLWGLASQYTLCDNFFMSAFGGSWLNHIFLISAQAPFYANANSGPAAKLVSVVDGDDPTGTRLKLAPDSPKSALEGPPKFVRDGALTADGYAVNTMAPPYQPSNVRPAEAGDPTLADPANPRVLPPQDYATIGDRLSAKGVDWAWYSGAWQYALDHLRYRLGARFPVSPSALQLFPQLRAGHAGPRAASARCRPRRRCVDQQADGRHRRRPAARRHVLQAARQPEHARRLRGCRIGRPAHHQRDRADPARAAVARHGRDRHGR